MQGARVSPETPPSRREAEIPLSPACWARGAWHKSRCRVAALARVQPGPRSEESPGARSCREWRCLHGAARAQPFLPAFVHGLQLVPEPIQPHGPSEHGHPQLCSARGCGSHKLCRASVGAMGLGTRAGLGAGPPLGGCSVPSTPDCRGRETRGWFPVGVRPHCGGSAPGKGAGWEVREEKPQPLPSPLLPGLPKAGRGGRDPRHGGVPAAQLAFKNAISHGCAVNYQASVQRGVRHEGAFVSV